MVIYLVLAALAIALSLLCTFVIRAFALDVAIVDVPGERKVHLEATPRFGGAAVYLAFALAMALAFDARRFLGWDIDFSIIEFSKLMIGGTIILLLGIWDDIRGASPMTKLVVQVGVAGLMVVLGYRIDAISNPFGDPIQLGLLSVPLTILWIVGICNALNLIDGVDGLAAGVTLISALSSFLISFFLGNEMIAVAYAVLFGVALGFLRFNFNPATIFLGDSGSLFLGFLLAVLSIKGAQKGPTSVAITVPILILGLPIIDTGVAFLRRSFGFGGDGGGRSERMNLIRKAFRPDKKHIHHRLLSFGFSQRQVVVILYGVSVLLSALAMLTVFANDRGFVGLLIFLLVIAFAASLHLGWFKFRRSAKALRRRPARVLLVSDRDEVRQPVGTLARELGLSMVCAGASESALLAMENDHFDVVIVDPDPSAPAASHCGRIVKAFRHAVPLLLRPEGRPLTYRDVAESGAEDWLASGEETDRWRATLRRAVEKAGLMAQLRFFHGLVWLGVILMPLLVALTFYATRDGIVQIFGGG